jgi:bifunctional ADP-heptose synthase (sugar kinase/adenylyltransferase)
MPELRPVLAEEKFAAILEALPSLRIAVAGDLFLDKWLEIDRSLDEPSVETGLTAYQVVRKRVYAGAAGTVLSNLAALDTGRLYAIGFTGGDGEGFELRRALQAMGVNLEGVAAADDMMTPAYTKPVFLKDPQAAINGGTSAIEESNRLDHRNIRPASPEIEDRIIASLRGIAPQVDALIALDQITVEGYGVLTPKVRDELARDRRRSSRPDCLRRFPRLYREIQKHDHQMQRSRSRENGEGKTDSCRRTCRY